VRFPAFAACPAAASPGLGIFLPPRDLALCRVHAELPRCGGQHTLFRKETRWPGYYYRGDHMRLDDENWHCFTLSRYDSDTGKWAMEKAPVYHIVE